MYTLSVYIPSAGFGHFDLVKLVVVRLPGSLISFVKALRPVIFDPVPWETRPRFLVEDPRMHFL